MEVSLSLDGHTVIFKAADGTVREKKYTSHAEARHFVEQFNNTRLPVRSTAGNKHSLRRGPGKQRSHKPLDVLSPEQLAIKQKAMLALGLK